MEREKLPMLGDCPLHENVRWELTGNLLRSAVPNGKPGPVVWDTCLASDGTGAALSLKACNESEQTQRFTVSKLDSSGFFQLRQGGQCISGPVPLPPPKPPPTLDPV